MTTVYKVKIKHTKRCWRDFIRFDNKVRHPLTMHLTVLRIGFFGAGLSAPCKGSGNDYLLCAAKEASC